MNNLPEAGLLGVPAIRSLRCTRNELLARRDALSSEAVIRRHAVSGLQPHPRYLTNFLGVWIGPKFFLRIPDGRAGQIEPAPMPASCHADIAEWAAALRAVNLAPGGLAMIKLGCGWECWMNNTGVAARRTGRAVRLIGIEEKLFEVLLSTGWRLEIEHPCRLHLIEEMPSTCVGGVEGWGNPMLLT